MRFAAAVLMILTLVACGASTDGDKSEEASEKAAPAAQTEHEEYDAEDNAEAIAALPAPLNAASYDRGRAVFARCRSCHTVNAGGRNGTGPNLHGIIGARSGEHAQGFAYSPAMRGANLTWDIATLDAYLENPMAHVPGTRMAFAGIRNADERRDVIAYIAVESQR